MIDKLPERLSVEFLTSAPDRQRAPAPDQLEIAIAGRSNAGKSSVLNRLTGNRRTAKVSRTPGRTQLLNFFAIVGANQPPGRLVDLPGYGFAKAAKASQANWQAAVNDYLSHRDCLGALVLVMDIRHPLQPYDVELLDWADASGLPVRILLNKADKLRRGARQQTLMAIKKNVSKYSLTSVQLFSALRGEGQQELLACLLGWLSSAEEVSDDPEGTSAAGPREEPAAPPAS